MPSQGPNGEQKRIDAALLHVATTFFPVLASEPLADERLVVAIPAEHALARNADKPVTPRMLIGQDFVVYRRLDGPDIFDAIMRGFDGARVKIRVVDEVRRLVAAINLVAAGRGITIVPASIHVLHREAIVYRHLARGAVASLPLKLVYRKADDLTLVRNFIALTTGLAKASHRGR